MTKAIRVGAVGIALMLITSACGTRLSHDRIVADAYGPSAARSPQGAGVPAGPETPSTGPAAPALPSENGSTSGAGGSDTTADTRGQAGPAASDPACNKEPIRVGWVGPQSGIIGSVYAGMPQAVQAWAKMVNDAGGINCHAVQVFVADDQGDPSRGNSQVRDLVENKKVVALVGSAMPFTGLSTGPYLEQKRIPVIGGDGSTPIWWENRMFFPQVLHVYDQQYLMVAAGHAVKGGKSFAFFYCAESRTCATARSAVEASAKALGGRLVYSASISVAQPDFTAECLQAAQRDADVVVFAIDAFSVGRFATACARQNYRPTYASQGLGLNDSMLRNPNLEGVAGGEYSAPWFLTSGSPALEEYGQAMKRYASDVGLTPAVGLGWTAAKLFEKVATTTIGPSDTPTSDKLLQGLWAIQNETLGGLVPPLRFARDAPAPAGRCGYSVAVKEGKWVTPKGLTLLCSTIPR